MRRDAEYVVELNNAQRASAIEAHVQRRRSSCDPWDLPHYGVSVREDEGASIAALRGRIVISAAVIDALLQEPATSRRPAAHPRLVPRTVRVNCLDAPVTGSRGSCTINSQAPGRRSRIDPFMIGTVPKSWPNLGRRHFGAMVDT